MVNWRIGKLALAVAFVIGSAAFQGSPAIAAPDRDHILALVAQLSTMPRSDAEALWLRLSSAEQGAVTVALSVDRVEVKTTSRTTKLKNAQPMLAGCDRRDLTLEYYSLANVHLFDYHQHIDWCFDGTTVTSAYRTRWGATYAPWWVFRGHIDSTESGGAGYTSYYAYTQGSFEYCPPFQFCTFQTYPYIGQTGYGSGGFSQSWGPK